MISSDSVNSFVNDMLTAIENGPDAINTFYNENKDVLTESDYNKMLFIYNKYFEKNSL